MTQTTLNAAKIIAKELQVSESQVNAAIQLMDEGATVPFIARYRKEVTKGLDDIQLRKLSERLTYLRELDERRNVILNSIQEQDKLTDSLKQKILSADTKSRLEDLYLPFKPKRRTKASIAIEAGLEPLATKLLASPEKDPNTEAKQFLNSEYNINDEQSALEGAQFILIDYLSEDASLIDELREYLWQHGVLKSKARKKDGKKEKNKYADYLDYAEPIKKIPSHRALAIFRGRKEGELRVSLELSDNTDQFGEEKISNFFKINFQQRAADEWLKEAVHMAWKTKLFPKLELELFTRLREASDKEAIHVFASNLKDLLLAAPAGPRVTIGLDPGIRTGVKLAVVDETGKLLDYSTIYPFAPKNEWHQAVTELAKYTAKYNVSLFSIGNGTGSRDTERLVNDMLKMYPDLNVEKMVVNEAGASVYSASALATEEFPDVDVSIRGAVSIARRIQDPLAELVKIEAKSIGVGQYQHDVNQTRLAMRLDAVVEDCVNAVGTDVNTASIALLSHVSGLNLSIASNIIQYRNENGAFTNREQLKEIPKIGEKTFQQAAGFLRIRNGDNPLDASSVHPESYSLVEKIAKDEKVELDKLIANPKVLSSIKPENYQDDTFGQETVLDVVQELKKPGRDPRPEFKTVKFKEGIEDISDLEEGMILEGVVSNVTNFGAFVDIGVHQDGLIHISEMKQGFIKDPRDIVKTGDIVKVKVSVIDTERRRINLSMKTEQQKPTLKAVKNKKDLNQAKKTQHKQAKASNRTKAKPEKKGVFNTTMADALAKLKKGSD